MENQIIKFNWLGSDHFRSCTRDSQAQVICQYIHKEGGNSILEGRIHMNGIQSIDYRHVQGRHKY